MSVSVVQIVVCKSACVFVCVWCVLTSWFYHFYGNIKDRKNIQCNFKEKQKKKKNEGLTLQDSKTYFKTIVVKIVWHCSMKKITNQWHRDFRNRLCKIIIWFFTKLILYNSWEIIVFSIIVPVLDGQTYGKKSWQLPCIIFLLPKFSRFNSKYKM